jgi:hypothetical protein
MHVMLKRAAASAIPALLGLAVSPATTMAAPHTARAVAGPVKGGRETHERLAQLPRSGTHQGHLAGTTSTAETTADTYRLNSTDAGFATTPAIPAILAFRPAFVAIPVYPDSAINGGGIARLASFSRVPGHVNVGAPAYGIINYGKYDKSIGNHVTASAGSGFISYRNVTGNGTGAVVSH